MFLYHLCVGTWFVHHDLEMVVHARFPVLVVIVDLLRWAFGGCLAR